MKKNTLLIFSFFYLSVYAQVPNWLWARSSVGYTIGNSIATDKLGNVYVTGAFSGDTIKFGNVTLVRIPYKSIYIVKYDFNGNVIWARQDGGDKFDQTFGIATDLNGNVFVTGCFFSSSITFGTTTLYNSSGWNDIFIVKYDPNGNVLWAKKSGGAGVGEWGHSVATDVNGNVYVTGVYTSQSISFGSIILNNSNYANSQVFLVKYDSAGNALWAKTSSNGSGYGQSVATDINSNVYVTGEFYGTLNLNGTLVYSSGVVDMFVAKYDSNGNILWTKSGGGTYFATGKSIATDIVGNIFVTGSFQDTTVLGNDTLVSNGVYDIFLVKYDSNGNVIWTKGAGGNYYDDGFCTTTDVNGNVYITGGFRSDSIIFDSTVLNHSSYYYSDIFLAKYNPNGNLLWAKSVKGNKEDVGYSVATGIGSSIYISGIFTSDSIFFSNDTLFDCAPNSYEMFIAKLRSYDGNTLNVEEFNNSISVNIFPNPSSGIFTVNLRNCRDAKICVYDVLGNCLLNKNCRSDVSPKIDLSCQPKGIYFVELLSGTERRTEKIIIE